MIIGGGLCCIGAAALYVTGVYCQCQWSADQLKSVTRVHKLNDLAQLWDAARPVYPLVVAVSGWLRSDTPIKWQYSDLKCVLVEIKREHHILKRDDKGKWKEESNFLPSKWKEVPWYLDDGTSRARVLGARWASGLHLQYAGDVLERSIQSRHEEIFELDNGLKPRGVKKIERVLPIGIFVTVVGEMRHPAAAEQGKKNSNGKPGHDFAGREILIVNGPKIAKSASRKKDKPRNHGSFSKARSEKKDDGGDDDDDVHEGKFSDYISKVKNRMMKSASNVNGSVGGTFSRRDSFNDKVANYINQAKIKIRTSTNIGDRKSLSLTK